MKLKQILPLMLLPVLSMFSACSDDDSTVTSLQSLSLNKQSLTLSVGGSETLSCTFSPADAADNSVKWTTSDGSVATVSDNGLVTGVAEGTANIIATSTAHRNIADTCIVTVGNGGSATLTVNGEVSGTWKKNTIVNVTGHLTVPKGQNLTIEEGVQVIFNTDGVGTSHTPIEFIVDGSLYTKGTEENPILLSIPEEMRTADNSFGGLWGGIVATAECPEMLIDHTIIEYTGGAVSQDSPSALKGIYTPGEDYDPQITTNNVNGRYIITNSVLRYGVSDGIYMMGGQGIIQHNTFVANGETGGEAVNVKAGCKVDVAYNLMFSPNTNGLKLSSSGQNDEAGRKQALVCAYNNTIVNAGWRRDGVKGGSVYVEKNALVSVFNNLMVNCKFKAMTPKWGKPAVDAGAASESVIDYNYYAAGSVSSNLPQDVEDQTTNSFLGYTTANKNVFTDYIDLHSPVSASAGDAKTNPSFVNYDINAVGLLEYRYNDAWDFHVNASSPVLKGAYSGTDTKMQPYFAANALSVGGQSYVSEKAAARFGAFGTR